MKYVLLLILLSGCASYDVSINCQKELGPRPNQWTNMFGLVGAIANSQQPETQAYDDKMDKCRAKYLNSLPPSE